jgi:hypothetical protein
VIQEAFAILERIEASPSRKIKEQALDAHAENLALQTIIRLAYGAQRYNVYPDRTCHIDNRMVRTSGGIETRFQKLQDLCETLSSREATGQQAFDLLKSFLRGCPSMEHKWFSRIFDRDLGIGIGKLTIPKIWPDLLRGDCAFKGCMLAEEWEKKTQSRKKQATTLQEPFLLWSEPKMDGLRVTTLIDELGHITLWTRGGKPVEHLPHIERALKELGARDIVLDGEMCCFDRATGLTDWRKTLSLAKPRKKITEAMAKDIEETIEYHLFDAIPLHKYLLGSCPIPLRKRRTKLKLVLALDRNGPLKLVKRTKVQTMEDIRRCYESYLEKGFEGSIIKDPEAPYVCKRSRSWLKLKPTRDKTGVITGFKRGNKGHSSVSESVVSEIVSTLSKWGKVTVTKIGYEVTAPEQSTFDKFYGKLPLYLRQRLVYSHMKQKVSFRTVARLGSLQIVPKGEKNWIYVGGMKTDLREEIWDHKKRYLGQWIDYVEQQDPGNTGSTRFCRFIRFRAVADID